MTSDTPPPTPAPTRVSPPPADASLAAALAAGTVVLDGGMSNQLEAAGTI